MDHVLNWLWQGCLVALATGSALRRLERSRARHRYVLCWIALLTVLVLPFLPRFWIAASPAEHLLDAPAPVVSVLSMPTAWWTSSTVVIILWALWSTVQGARVAIALLALRQARRACVPFPSAIESRLRYWNKVSAPGRRTRLALSYEVRSAAVLGCCSPVIAVAPTLLQHVSVDALDRIVIHEWAHVQRRDDVVNLVHLAVRIIAGWHPGVWWLDRQLQIEREAACDEIAVSVTGCPKSYAACLTTIATFLPMRLQPLPTLGALSAPGLSTRVVRILLQKHLVSPRSSTAAAIAAVLLLCGLSFAIVRFRMIVVSPQPIAQNAFAAPRRVLDAPSDTRRTEARMPKQASPRSRSTVPPHVGPRSAAPRAAAASTGPVSDDSVAQSFATERVPTVHNASTASLPPLDATPPALTVIPPHAPASVQPAPDVRPVSPWGAAADAGVAVGHSSQKAGMATATFFSRFGKKIAGSF